MDYSERTDIQKSSNVNKVIFRMRLFSTTVSNRLCLSDQVYTANCVCFAMMSFVHLEEELSAITVRNNY